MVTIHCHPDNLEALKRKVNRGEYDTPSLFNSIEIRTNKHLERTKPTGRYRLPSGAVVEKDSFRITTKFIDYGPEDIEWLLYAGEIEKETELLFWVMQEPMIRVGMNYMPVIDHRAIIYSHT